MVARMLGDVSLRRTTSWGSFIMRKYFAGVSAISLCALAAPALAETAEETAAVFGARQSVLHVSLSPSGKKLAYVAPFGSHGETLRSTSKPAPPQRSLVSDDIGRSYIVPWVTDERLICRLYMTTRDATLGKFLGGTVIAIDADGQNAQSIEHRATCALWQVSGMADRSFRLTRNPVTARFRVSPI